MKTTYAIWYQKNPTFRDGEVISVASIPTTHTFVVNCVEETLDGVFTKMQAEQWSPNGEARKLIKSLGLHHTSMSVGDVIHNKDDDTWWVCENTGWRYISAIDLPKKVSLIRREWKDLKPNDTVYLRGNVRKQGILCPCFYGPHRIVDTERRELENTIGSKFFHYPNDLYKEEVP